jgi:3-oxoacyl-[acyl-carrier-protein] synthase-1
VRCMKLALDDAGIGAADVEYVNAHATSTPVGDSLEAQSIAEVFGEGPWVSSTKSMTGHEIGAAGSNEAIYTLIMMREGFVAPSINIEEVDEECAGIRIAKSGAVESEIGVALSNSFGFGGVNTVLVFKRPA